MQNVLRDTKPEADRSSTKISIQGLGKQFQVKKRIVTALQEVSLEIPKGEFVCIVGPSGCGKTTLLRILAGLEKPTRGSMDIYHENPSVPLNSMVFQEHSIFPWMTVKKNIGYGLRMRKVPKAETARIVNTYLEKIGMKQFGNALPHQLSGGMRQRVSVARAFANDPEILLMDEPFAALDEQNRLLLQQELVRIWEETQKTVVFITHSIDEAIFLADRIYVMTAHPGTMKASFEIDLPRPRRIEDVRGSKRFMELFTDIWGMLREEVDRAKLEQGLDS